MMQERKAKLSERVRRWIYRIGAYFIVFIVALVVAIALNHMNWLAPLVDNAFNRCKSNIKFLEFSALGIAMCGQNISTYNKYTKLVFNNGNDIDNIIDKLFFRKDSRDYYYTIIAQQRKIIEEKSPLSPNGFWLEKNIAPYYNLYSIPQKTIHIDW